MATLGKWSGGTTTLLPTASWVAPNALFPTQDRNDGSAYGFASATSTLTLPGSDLPDGFLIVGAFEFHDTSNGRHNPHGRFIQASGTGNFRSGVAGGYNRDNSEDRAYCRTWAFIDNPSASATIQFQWKRDADAPTGGTERSEFLVIPLFYADWASYGSTSTTATGGTTPTLITGFSGTDGTNITIASNVITVSGDNKRYLVLASSFHEGLSNNTRTQRWAGLEIDGSFSHAHKGYTYYRNTNNDESGEMFTGLFETVTADRTIEMNQYRGIGVANLDGGADVDGEATSDVGTHSIVVLELNDSCEVFLSESNANSANLATTGPIDLNFAPAATFVGDSASFTRVSDSAVNVEVTTDVLFGANVSAASNIVSTGSRWTAYAEMTVNGVEDPDSVAGDYLRDNQTSADTFGWSGNLIGFSAFTAGQDIGFSVTELSGSEGGGGNVLSPSGWIGAWAINLDTMEDSGPPAVSDVGPLAAINRRRLNQSLVGR